MFFLTESNINGTVIITGTRERYLLSKLSENSPKGQRENLRNEHKRCFEQTKKTHKLNLAPTQATWYGTKKKTQKTTGSANHITKTQKKTQSRLL